MQNLYQIVEYMTKEYFVFEMLEKLLLVQMLFLLVHYVADMLHMNFSKATEICLLIRNLAPGDWKETVVPLTLSFSCGIVYYLMHTQQLVDTMTLMKENIYDTSDIAAILFDEDYYYLDANEAARYSLRILLNCLEMV